MDFQEKIKLIEQARVNYITFEESFREYLASGNSFNAAYNFFSINDIEEHKILTEKEVQIRAWSTKHASYRDASPVRLTTYSIVSELENIYDELCHNTGD